MAANTYLCPFKKRAINVQISEHEIETKEEFLPCEENKCMAYLRISSNSGRCGLTK